MPNTNSHSKFADVPLRVRSWVFIIAVFAGAVYNKITMRIFICWVSFQCLKELAKNKVLYIALSLLIVLFAYPHLFFLLSVPNGLLWLIFLVVSTELNDVFQYLSGKCFGKQKILPEVSPNKTIAGCVGGILLTPLVSVCLAYVLGLQASLYTWLLLGVAISFFGFWGDVCISFLKRKAGVKDTGNLIPGHGGLLDRMDSLLFNSIWFFLWVQ